MLDIDELTLEEIYALAETFDAGAPSVTLLRMAKFPAQAIPAAGNLNALEFWTAVADEIAKGVMPDGRRRLLAAARRRYPFSTKFPDPVANASPGSAGPASPVVQTQGGQFGDHNVQFNFFTAEPARAQATAGNIARSPRPSPGRAVPLRVLVAGAGRSDPDVSHVRAERESRAIRRAASPDRIVVEDVIGAEAAVAEKARSSRPDIIHFVCRGDGDYLVFNDVLGEANPVKASRIADFLRHYREADGLRLRGIVLAACDGNTLAPFFTGVADTVIAHHGKLSDPCGVVFAEQLYRRLNDTDDLAAAAREAARLATRFSAACESAIASLIVLQGGG